MKKLIIQMTDEEKQRFSKITGDMMVYIGEKRSIEYISKKLDLYPYQVEENIDELLYELRKQVGKWRFFKTLFIK